MNYSKLTQAMSPLNDIRRLKLPYPKAKKVYALCKTFEAEFSFFRQEETKLIETYAAKDEKGNPKMNQTGVITFDTVEAKNDYLAEIEKLCNTEIEAEIPLIVITPEDIGNQSVSPETIEKLEDIISFE